MVTACCPTCKLVLKWDTSNPFRPFCSERCKLIDLGAWADDVYVIPDANAYPEDLTQEFIDETRPEDDE